MRLLATLLVAVALIVPTTAQATPRVITGHSAELHPEGITWDPLRRTFLLGSIRHGTIEVVRGRTTRTLASDPRMVSVFGLHVVGNRVYATYGDMGVATRSTPDTAFKVSGLGVFDLVTGRPLHMVDLAIGPGRHAANDVAVDRDGTAYVTDPASDSLYRVDRNGTASVLVRDARLSSATIGLNGIVWHPDGYLLVVRYDTGTLLRVPLDNPGAFTEVALDRPLVGGDGMDLRPDGSLAVVTNGLGAPGEAAVTVLRSTDAWRGARAAHRVAPWGDPEPTTITRTPHGSYVVDGRLGMVVAGTGTTDEFVLRRLGESPSR